MHVVIRTPGLKNLDAGKTMVQRPKAAHGMSAISRPRSQPPLTEFAGMVTIYTASTGAEGIGYRLWEPHMPASSMTETSSTRQPLEAMSQGTGTGQAW